MKSIFITLTVFSFILIFSAICVAIQDDAALVLYYTFDEGEGETAVDHSGNGNDGEIIEAEWVAGKIEGALEFDGQTSYIRVPASDTTEIDTELTIEFWFIKAAREGGS